MSVSPLTFFRVIKESVTRMLTHVDGGITVFSFGE